MSGLEFKAHEVLETLGFIKQEDYIFNKSYFKLTDYCGKRLRPDFRFINHKIIIEVDGSQHYKVKEFGNSKEESQEQFLKTQENDNIKNEFCRIYGYKMIRIKYTKIMNMLEILHSELDEIIEY
jgi:very-short-patch-repair endonuclease